MPLQPYLTPLPRPTADYRATYTSTLSVTSPTVGNQTFTLPNLAAATNAMVASALPVTIILYYSGPTNLTLPTSGTVCTTSTCQANGTIYYKPTTNSGAGSNYIQPATSGITGLTVMVPIPAQPPLPCKSTKFMPLMPWTSLTGSSVTHTNAYTSTRMLPVVPLLTCLTSHTTGTAPTY